MTRFFVTGTDTNIGKTFVSTILAIGLNTRFWKPVQTGTIETCDSDFVRKWIGKGRVYEESYVFSTPVSPHLAAVHAGQKISIDRCLSDYEKLHGPLIVEGAGGVMVPLNEECLMVDLIAQLKIPALIVAGTQLGTINHTLLTLEALRSRDVTVAGFLTNGSQNADVANSIARIGRTAHLGHVEPMKDLSLEKFQVAFQKLKIGDPKWIQN